MSTRSLVCREDSQNDHRGRVLEGGRRRRRKEKKGQSHAIALKVKSFPSPSYSPIGRNMDMVVNSIKKMNFKKANSVSVINFKCVRLLYRSM